MNKIKHSEYEKPGSLSDEQGLQVMVLWIQYFIHHCERHSDIDNITQLIPGMYTSIYIPALTELGIKINGSI